MKKIYSFLAIFLACIGLSLPLSAQTTILDGLITVSDETTEVWYYIENGHNGSGGIISDNDGRFCALLTLKGNSDGTAIAGMPLLSVSDRDEQQWKVVSDGNTSYYLINKKNGEYLKQVPTNILYDTTNEVTEANLFSFTKYGTFVKIENKSLSSNNKLEMSNGGNTVAVTSWRLTNTGGGDPTINTATDAQLTGSPRGWRFVPASEINDFYPTVYDQGTAATAVKDWFFIKSLDTTISGETKYITIDEDGNTTLEEKSTTNPDDQLFGFISGGIYDVTQTGASTAPMGMRTQIIHKATGKYVSVDENALELTEASANWYLKHVYSPKNESQAVQGVIRTNRHGGNILSNSLQTKTVVTSSGFVDTYDNEYTWAFEKNIVYYSLSLTKDDEITVQTPADDAPYFVEEGESFILTFTISEGYEPVVTLDGVAATTEQLTETSGIYTLTINSVETNVAISIASKTPDPTELLGGLIKISKDISGPWYYIENGHSSDADSRPINDSDGRFGSLLSASTFPADISSESAFTDSRKDSQKWRVVTSDESGFYYIINKEGKYLTSTDVRYTFSTEDNLPDDASMYKFEFFSFTPTAEGSAYVKIKRQGTGDNVYVCQLNQGFSFELENSSTTAAGVSDNGMVSNPRAWRFVPEAQIDNFYPVIAPEGSTLETVGEWFRIKSLDEAITGEDKYLTFDATEKSFSLTAEADSDNQLFGFISVGYVAMNAANQKEVSYKIQIITKATGELLALTDTDVLTANETGKDWVLKHVYVPAKDEIQAVIKSHRYSTGTSPVNKIISNDLSEAQPSWTKTMNTADNKYTWGFERVSYEATVTAGENVTLTSPATASLKYGEELVITYEVPENFTPVVILNGMPSAVGTEVNGVYTLRITITGTTNVNITAESALKTVTVNAADYVTVVTPTLDENDQYTSPSTSTITFTLDAGYENPVIATTNAVAAEPTLTSGVYSVLLTEIEDGATIEITASLKEVTVTATKAEGIAWKDNQDPETEVAYGQDYTFSFTVDANYHSPKVVVNGSFYTPTEEAGLYTVTVNNVQQETIIYVGVFQANVLPVTADTWVRGGSQGDINNVNDPGLYAQYSTYNAPAYMRRSYMEFDASSFNGTYTKVTLKLTVDTFEKNPDIHIELRSAEILDDIAIADMTWNVNEENDWDAFGNVIGETPIILAKEEYPNQSVLELDVTEFVLNNMDAPFRLQITGVSSTGTDGYIRFYSDNGAAAINDLNFTPSLVFEALTETKTVTVTKADQITIESPEGSSPYIVNEGESFVMTFTVAANYIPEVKIGNTPATSEQLTLANGIYTLTIASVTEDIIIDITADLIDSMVDVDSGIVIYQENQSLIVKTISDLEVEVYNVSGQLVTKRTVNGTEIIDLARGLYIVKAGNKISKFTL